jgi:molybdopterin molybdotransferase
MEPLDAVGLVRGIPIPAVHPVRRALWAASRQVLAEAVTTERDIPPFHRSAVDGYAVRASDVTSVPATLDVVGVREAGDATPVALRPGQCLKIMTGAAVPADADAVVPVEETRDPASTRGEAEARPAAGSEGRPRTVAILSGVAAGANVAARGEDARAGSVVLPEGTFLNGQALAVAAGVGRKELSVYPLPKVALLQTGGELVEPGGRVGEHQIYNSNSTLLAGLLSDCGLGVAHYLGICRDEREALAGAIRRGLECDVLLLTGGVSKGDFDLVPEVLESCGARTVFRGVAIRPGKPVMFAATADGRFAFGLPGNPNSVLVCFYEFVVPLLERLARLKRPAGSGEAEAELTAAVRKSPGRWYYAACRFRWESGRLMADPVHAHGSGDYVNAGRADGVVLLPRESTGAGAGERVRAHMWGRLG